ncbi:MAG: Ig-like domain-containing protein, partial [Candidatus Nomurabacteria bacterium]|nr:Ig-like domain-containing protein [Candidatus Nomurabacteria bacterium]
MQIKKILPVSFLLLVTLLFSNTALAYSDGSLDTVFNPGTGTNSRIVSTVLQPDGKILIGGYFTSYNGTTRNGVARINSDGSLDATFNPGTGIAGGADTSVRSVSVQSDGKIIIGGSFMTYNGVARQNLARLNTDGTLDATFDSSLGANNTVRATAVQSDGKILIGGDFTSYEDIGLGRIARLNSNGTLDSSFNPGIGVDDSVAIITFQSDGKILIGGYFTNYDGTSRNGIARLNTNGSLDATFNPGTGTNNGVHSISFQSNGKLIIGGGYTLYNGVSRRSIARLNTDGSLDNTFNPGSGANNTIFSAPIQSDGKILVAGDFTTFNGLSYNRIARLNTDGSLDATFNPGLGANFVINSIAIPSDNYVIIGGSFNTYNGTSRNNIARLGVVSVQVPTPTNPPDMTSATDTGVSNNDNITSDNTPDFQMICVSGNTVTLYIDNVAISPTALCVGNTAIITPAVALSNDAHNVTYTEKNGGVESGKSPVLAISIQTNTSLITVLEIAPIGVTGDITPNYIFSTDKAGTITYGGDCSSPTTVATLGFNTVTFNMLPVGVHSNCTIKITDSLGNVSNT